MAKLITKLQSNNILKALASVKITVIGLLLLFILTFWGTIAQVNHGLYASQERYFSSLYFLAMGFLPFPGGQLVLWILGINLIAALFNRKLYAWSQIGLIIIHYGLLLFLVAAFVTFHEAKESHMTLAEGQAANFSETYSKWEIALWPASGSAQEKTVTATDADHLTEGATVAFAAQGLIFNVKSYYKNSRAVSAPFAGIKETYINDSGLNLIKPRASEKEPEKNIPTIIMQFADAPSKSPVLLYGADMNPTTIVAGGGKYFVSLRRQHYPLPLTLKLIDFIMEKHPGTDIARTYKSKVEVQSNGANREVVISMNEPLRYKQYTFYQASYQIDEMGNEYSTLAVVKNAGRVLPYWATFVVVFGLALHFLLAAFGALKPKK